jgi:hypothetical protein
MLYLLSSLKVLKKVLAIQQEIKHIPTKIKNNTPKWFNSECKNAEKIFIDQNLHIRYIKQKEIDKL